MNIGKLLFIDIETAGLYATEELATDHRKQVKNQKISNGKVDNCALFPELSTIVCICIGYEKDGILVKKTFSGGEKILLQQFIEIIEKIPDHVFCGHNIKNFDLPFICIRCIANGLIIPQKLNNIGKKPREIDVVDTMELWKMGGISYSSLDSICLALGVDSPKGELDGSMVHEYFHNGKLGDIIKYCEKDVTAIYECVKKILPFI